jgi:hypothetical protein
METQHGIEYLQDAQGSNRYVVIDLQQHGGNEALEDFLDSIEIELHRGEESMSLEEFNQQIDKRMQPEKHAVCMQ